MTQPELWEQEFFNQFGNEGLFADKGWAGKEDEFKRVMEFIAKVRAEAIATERAHILEALPKDKKPDDGNGDEDAINHGHNTCLEKVRSIIMGDTPYEQTRTIVDRHYYLYSE